MRIVDSAKKQALTNPERAAFSLLGYVLVANPASIKRLLEKYGVDTTKIRENSQLATVVLYQLSEGSEKFTVELAEILADQQNEQEQEDNWVQTLVPLITDSLGTAVNAISGQNRKIAEAEGKQAIASGMYAYQLEQKKLEKEKREEKGKVRMTYTIGAVVVLGVIGYLLIKNKEKS